MNHWLMKTEPETFSLEDLAASPGQTTSWEGVRNYQARNLMRDAMKTGDRVLFYHSRTGQPAVVALARVVGEAVPDPTAQDPASPFFDPKSTPQNPIWVMVDIQLERPLPRPVSLKKMRGCPQLESMVLLKKGMRLSVQPVTPREFAAVAAMGGVDL
ncbi:MAG: EVE domain-containing protein [Deltaproteobacteria bacterium]|nr:EVE domain-containing protein [Deltaproteobacteria bacterium]